MAFTKSDAAAMSIKDTDGPEGRQIGAAQKFLQKASTFGTSLLMTNALLASEGCRVLLSNHFPAEALVVSMIDLGLERATNYFCPLTRYPRHTETRPEQYVVRNPTPATGYRYAETPQQLPDPAVLSQEDKEDPKPETVKPEKPYFQEYLDGKPFEKADDLTHAMQAELFGIEGVSDFGIAASSYHSPLVVNCSPAHKELAEGQLKEFETRHNVAMVVIWQDINIRGLMNVDGTLHVDQSYKMNRFDHGGSALGLPVRFEGRRALLGMYHTLASQIHVAGLHDDDIEEQNVDMRFVAFHGNTFWYLGTEAKGTVKQFDKTHAHAVTGEVSLTFMKTWNDTEVRVLAPLLPSRVLATNAPIDAADRKQVWDEGRANGGVWKNGPITGSTDGHVVYIGHSFIVPEPFQNEQTFSDGVVVIHDNPSLPFSQPGDSSSVVYFKGIDGDYSLLGAVCAGSTCIDKYGESGVWTYTDRPDGPIKADMTSGLCRGNVQWSKSVTHVLLYHNLFRLVQEKYGAMPEPAI